MTAKGLRNPIPPEGLVLDAGSATIQVQLVVSQEGDRNLVYNNVRGALQEMLNYYNSQTTDLLPMSEVSVSDGFYLEGYVTMSGKDATCAQPAHLNTLGLPAEDRIVA